MSPKKKPRHFLGKRLATLLFLCRTREPLKWKITKDIHKIPLRGRNCRKVSQAPDWAFWWGALEGLKRGCSRGRFRGPLVGICVNQSWGRISQFVCLKLVGLRFTPPVHPQNSEVSYRFQRQLKGRFKWAASIRHLM